MANAIFPVGVYVDNNVMQDYIHSSSVSFSDMCEQESAITYLFHTLYSRWYLYLYLYFYKHSIPSYIQKNDRLFSLLSMYKILTNHPPENKISAGILLNKLPVFIVSHTDKHESIYVISNGYVTKKYYDDQKEKKETFCRRY